MKATLAEHSTLKIAVSDNDHILGSENALITIVEYADLQCPHCRETYRILKQLITEYEEKIRFVFRSFPLSTVHSQAQRAAEALEAAAAQGKFWVLYHHLYENSFDLTSKQYLTDLSVLGLDSSRLLADLNAEVYRTTVRECFRGGVRSGVNGTPTLFFNGRRYTGELTSQALRSVIVSLTEARGSALDQLAAQPKVTVSEDLVDKTPQQKLLSKLEQQAGSELTAIDIEQIFKIAEAPESPEAQTRAAVLISEHYPQLAPNYGKRIHALFLRGLKQAQRTFAHPSCNLLMVTHLRDENLKHIPWHNPEEVVTAAECFYGSSNAGISAEESHLRVRDVVKFAGQHFVSQGRWEDAFRLLSQIPLPSDAMDADLFRLRNALTLYENRRVRRVRRAMATAMLVVICSVLTISPALFQLWENPHRTAHDMSALSFFDALYWSVITFATVGYGDITPQTVFGRALALVNCLLGVTVMGVTAGLLLSYVTPRKLS